ncbi:TetR/AcrR family transcriptional regulator [Leifsonia sp. 2MCAF36]|uniref:TetR/AcrR family transcriptional regulator n=1 Tax=Leifsonia sp. 2MCAF36 TaxID=3232988 RepID=UPI003F9CBABC
MPAPDRTSLDAIVLAARKILETDGLTCVTMQAVAARVGVRAPSLYKRVRNRDELIRLVAEATLRDLTGRLHSTSNAQDLLNGLRVFAKESPAAFQLVMTPDPGAPVASSDVNIASSAGILRVASDLAGEASALEAARTLTAWATGFISMELNGRFRLGGDVDRAWEFGLTRIIRAVGMPSPS